MFVGTALALWIALSVLMNIFERGRNLKGTFIRKLSRHPRAFWGMHLAHLGIAVFVIGVASCEGVSIRTGCTHVSWRAGCSQFLHLYLQWNA